jgi:glycosyltransferase involved in cell wall biosynthesis
MRVCFVAHNAFGALSGRASEHSGGIERQTALWARWFADRGHQVTLLSWDVGQTEGGEVNGVRVVKMCRREDGWPGLRFLHPRWTSLAAALRRADADAYHYMSGDAGLGQVALWCRAHRRLLTYYVSSTWAAERELPHLRPWRERLLYRVGLRHAGLVMVQTSLQQRLLNESFGVASTVVPMPCADLARERTDAAATIPARGTRVLWVGRVSPEKRLEWLVDAALACPDVTFDVAGASNDDSPYAAALLSRARTVPNLVLHGRVSDNDALSSLYRQAALLCCTSRSEGFPNTFLEAWSHGLPVVSTYDPDGMIERRGLGLVAGDVAGVVAGIRELLTSPEVHRRTALNAIAYVRENHSPDVVLPRVERMFVAALGATGPGSTWRGSEAR